MDETPPSGRLLDVPETELTPAQREGVAALLAGRGRLLAPYRIWLHSPELMRAMEQLGTFLNKRSSLTEREVELGICAAARRWAGEYVFRSHAARCLELGVPREALRAIAEDRVPELDDARERAVLSVVHMAGAPGAGPDAEFNAAVAALGRDGLAEVICLLGYYSAVAIGMKLHRVAPRHPAV